MHFFTSLTGPKKRHLLGKHHSVHTYVALWESNFQQLYPNHNTFNVHKLALHWPPYALQNGVIDFMLSKLAQHNQANLVKVMIRSLHITIR